MQLSLQNFHPQICGYSWNQSKQALLDYQPKHADELFHQLQRLKLRSEITDNIQQVQVQLTVPMPEQRLQLTPRRTHPLEWSAAA